MTTKIAITHLDNLGSEIFLIYRMNISMKHKERMTVGLHTLLTTFPATSPLYNKDMWYTTQPAGSCVQHEPSVRNVSKNQGIQQRHCATRIASTRQRSQETFDAAHSMLIVAS